MIRVTANAWIPRLAAFAASALGILPTGPVLALGEHSSGSGHWAFQPLNVPDSDEFSGIDDFVDRRLEQQNLPASERADRRTLFRRLSFDLTGLPPESDAVHDFLQDTSPGAWERVVDQALSSPRFGETWARYWLDLVRFSETKGHATDIERPHSWKYRDYVIDAFNQDLPYDRFIREHLAGDLLETQRGNGRGETRVGPIATGFLFFQEMHFMAVDPVQQRWDEIDAQIDVISKTFLGLTLACARCHDHKMDPTTQEDYYAMAGILYGTELDHVRTGDRAILDSETTHVLQQKEKAYEDFLQNKIDGRLAAQKKKNSAYFPVSRELGVQSPNDYQQLRKLMEPLEKLDPSWAYWARSAVDVEGEDVAIHLRGNYKTPGKLARRASPAIVRRGAVPDLGNRSGRLYLAEQIAHPENPLTARVWVNRIWQRLLGDGLVRTPNDFGLAGKKPTHPELLDYLASRLIESGWSTKSVIREILLSDVYQRSSQTIEEVRLRDPNNLWLARRSAKRLDAEAVRDSLLALSGALEPVMHGPGVQPYIPDYATGNKVTTIPESGPLDGAGRRSIYIKVRRNYYTPFLKNFNAADPGKCVGKRESSTAPLQALALMNSEFSHEMARRWGESLAQMNKSVELKPILQRMFESALTREPSPEELQALTEFASDVQSGQSPAAALVDSAHVIFNLAEFILIE